MQTMIIVVYPEIAFQAFGEYACQVMELKMTLMLPITSQFQIKYLVHNTMKLQLEH